jgi:hypothetical protein
MLEQEKRIILEILKPKNIKFGDPKILNTLHRLKEIDREMVKLRICRPVRSPKRGQISKRGEFGGDLPY